MTVDQRNKCYYIRVNLYKFLSLMFYRSRNFYIYVGAVPVDPHLVSFLRVFNMTDGRYTMRVLKWCCSFISGVPIFMVYLCSLDSQNKESTVQSYGITWMFNPGTIQVSKYHNRSLWYWWYWEINILLPFNC